MGSLYAQNSPDCRTAIPVCADAPIAGVADGGGIDDFDPDFVRYSGCLEKGSNTSENIENNTSWYVFRAGKDGQIGFNIKALPVTGGPNIVTAEWDFAVYGPDVDCLAIGAGIIDPIRCNFETNDTPYTGIGINPENGEVGAPFVKQSRNTYDEWLEVQEGEIYYILINNWNTNFDDEAESFELTFTGSSVDADQNNALDCTLRDEFLGLDITVCEGDPPIVLSARNSPAGTDIANITWSVDYEDDGIIDNPNLASGPTEFEYTVTSPNAGRYFVEITTVSGTPPTVEDDILITFFKNPRWYFQEVISRDDLSDNNIVEIVMANPDGDYEFAINGGEFQDDPIFANVAPGENTVIINDKYGCGTTESIPFLVVGYPKFFTPNGDGIHDHWNVLGISTLINPVVSIFDRYGKLLKQLDETSIGWDGTFNGKPMPSSDYWFRMDYFKDASGIIVARSVRTHFTLKR
ncbi:T9SS type B sorting domain-containing protein [Arenibacter sp. H213]|uniref:T9SS type B sorting domain-containing protein n=1 Tax=Arenibacter antarcticus TaxID=2040469 RepID=A0ABW5VCL7_9FLAO|nr:T9SS type B sorting domain-containing protein [Arenibacter sp. H213]